jgi:hypothetical protein
MLAKLNTALLLAILGALLWIATEIRAQPEAGRYVKWSEDESSMGVLDTATGLVYGTHIKNDEQIVIDPKEGSVTIRPLKRDTSSPRGPKDSGEQEMGPPSDRKLLKIGLVVESVLVGENRCHARRV